MEKWFIKNRPGDLDKISKTHKISKFLGKILVNRGINEEASIDRYLNPSLDRMYDPILMKDMDKGVRIIKEKIENGDRIRIVGDYDVDGVISIYTLYRGIGRFGGQVDYVIPNRVEDGYGINQDIVRKAKEDGIDTLITCDNGIAAIEEIALAKDLGMTVIVTDHHDMPFREDESGDIEYIHTGADAVINPKQVDCNYPFKLLCGGGIVYKFIQHLYKLYDIQEEEIHEFLEYAAIATVCDVVDLVDENRIIVKKGLELLNRTENIGLQALIQESGIQDKDIGVYHLGFVIGPSINASGRLDTAEMALDLLLAEDLEEAKILAKELRLLNDQRKNMTNNAVEDLIEKIEKSGMEDDKVLLVYEPDIHESIAGIVAGRIKDRENKPTIVLTQGKDGVKGSARSIKEYNIFEELTKCKDILNRFGGHPMAAGLSLDLENVDELRRRLNQYTSLTDEDLIPKKYIDMQLPLDYISFKLMDELHILEPFGKGNSKPVFGDKDIKAKRAQVLGKNKNVLKFLLESKDKRNIDAIYFGDIEEFEEMARRTYGSGELDKLYRGLDNDIYIDILYYPNINEFRGNKTLQAVIETYRMSK